MKHRYATQAGIDFIKGFEAFSPTVYICPAGFPTIGYGHVVLPSESLAGVSRDEGEELLRRDLFKAERAVLRFIGVPLKDSQFDALVSFAFNAGNGALQRSTLRAKLNRGEYEDAADEFSKWIRGGGRILKGLVRRRKAERDMFIGGI